ncbi:hypothetical protein KC19_VG235800 [Ceratodon purpureus]|uniref:Uncharacterized protein n=1 Tax=Ceratodon purpureus TaxID=3225 RepID=A0A8T0HUC1_CERPU|nr:hypothetical protein KC19_VG235800 [Ceratodon purpureus]
MWEYNLIAEPRVGLEGRVREGPLGSQLRSIHVDFETEGGAVGCGARLDSAKKTRVVIIVKFFQVVSLGDFNHRMTPNFFPNTRRSVPEAFVSITVDS